MCVLIYKTTTLQLSVKPQRQKALSQAYLWQNLLVVVREVAGGQGPWAGLTLEDVDLEGGAVVAAPLAVVVDVLQRDAGGLGHRRPEELEVLGPRVDPHVAGVKVAATACGQVCAKKREELFVSLLNV